MSYPLSLHKIRNLPRIGTGLGLGLTPKRFRSRNLGYRRQARQRQIQDISHRVKALSPFRFILISDSEIKGFRGKMGDLYLAKYGDRLTYTVLYRNLSKLPVKAEITQTLQGVGIRETTVFRGEQSKPYLVSTEITEPLSVTGEAWAETYRVEDHESKSFPIAFIHTGPKPLTEYPEQGLENTVLDIAYDWSVGNTVYPSPLPDGLTIKNMEIRFIDGDYRYEGDIFLHPTNTLEFTWTLRNETGSTITLEHWGIPLTVLYEDNRHVTQAQLDLGFPDRQVDNNTSTSYSFRSSMPIEWCYGRISLAHAVIVVKDGQEIYGGGPLYNYEYGKLILP